MRDLYKLLKFGDSFIDAAKYLFVKDGDRNSAGGRLRGGLHDVRRSHFQFGGFRIFVLFFLLLVMCFL